MERLLFAYAGVGLATGAAALALLALTPFLEKRYAARFRCIVWLALAVRLLVPFAAPLPAPRLSRCCWSCPPRCRIRRGQGKHRQPARPRARLRGRGKA